MFEWTTQAITACVIGSAIVLLVAYDIWARLREKNADSTISAVVRDWSFKYPIIAFAFGVLMGHFFWQNCPGGR